jgi:hypothetical protein
LVELLEHIDELVLHIDILVPHLKYLIPHLPDLISNIEDVLPYSEQLVSDYGAFLPIMHGIISKNTVKYVQPEQS